MKLILVLLLACAAVLPARAQDAFLTNLPRLGAGFAEQATAAEEMGAAGDPRALPVLQALAESRLLRRPDGTLLMQTAPGQAVLAATNEAADPAGAELVRINNRVRGALRVALGRLQIVATDPEARLTAVQGVLRSRSAADIPLLEAALARETVARIRTQITLALAASRLASDNPDLKRMAITALRRTGLTPRAASCSKRAPPTRPWPRRSPPPSRRSTGACRSAVPSRRCSRACRSAPCSCSPPLAWR